MFLDFHKKTEPAKLLQGSILERDGRAEAYPSLLGLAYEGLIASTP